MTQQHFALIVVSFLFAQNAHGQIEFELPPSTPHQVTAQINSPHNYELLKPIGGKAKTIDASQMLQPKASSQPLVPRTAKLQTVLSAPPTPTGMLSPSNQTTAAPTGMLSPSPQTPAPTAIAASRETATLTETATAIATETPQQNDSLQIMPHSFQSGNFDKYTFKISNPSSRTLRKAKVMLKSPVGSSFVQVTPKPKSVDGEEIVFEIGELAPGAFQMVEIMIDNPRDELARFETSIVSQQYSGSPEIRSDASQELASTANAQLLQPSTPVDLGPLMPEFPATSRREGQDVQLSMDHVLKAKNSSVDNGASENSVQSFANLTPETASESQQLGGVVSLLSGPTDVVVGEEVEFSVSLRNETQTKAGSLIVQLSIPEDFKITVLDRAAWYDAESRKISWQVPAIEAFAEETIRYKAVAKSAGLVKQGVVVGMGDSLQGFCSFKTIVR